MAPSPAGTAFCMAWPRSLQQPRRVAEGERAGSGQRGVFAQRMAGDDHGGFLLQHDAAFLLQHAQHRERVRHQRRLGVLGQDQLLARALEHQLRELLAEGVVHLLEQLARGGEGGGELAAHADRLASLAGEDEGVDWHWNCSPVRSGRGVTLRSRECQWKGQRSLFRLPACLHGRRQERRHPTVCHGRRRPAIHDLCCVV